MWMSLLAAALVATSASAADIVSGGLYYQITGDSEVAVVAPDDGTTYEGIYIIPEAVSVDGFTYSVTAIADSAFFQAEATEVQIPNSVLTIGEGAFALDEELVSITLPVNLQSVSRFMLAETSIVNIAIPEGVTTIGYGAFQSCSQLHTVFLPSTTTTLLAYAFNNCHNLFEIYCAAPTPPKATAWAIFIGLTGIDLIVPDEEAADRYAADGVWGDTETFSIWKSDEVGMSMSLNGEVFRDNWMRLPLGENMAYKIYGSDGYLQALTAADYYYFEILDHDETYLIVPTTLMADGEDMAYTVQSSGIVEPIDEEPHPIIVAHDGTIYISGDNHGKWTRVWDMYGMLWYERPSVNNVISLPTGRVYIVQVGNYVKKIVL